MRFSVQSKLLLTRLQAVGKVVSSKNTISILENFLFNLSGNELEITASDQETTLVTRVEVSNAEGNGKFAAGAKMLLELLKELPDQGLDFDINDANLEIKLTYFNGQFNFIGLNGNEFPVKAPSDVEPVSFTMPVKNAVAGVQHTVFAVYKEALRPILTGVYWDIFPEDVRFVATDTKVLVRYTHKGIAPGVDTAFALSAKPASILASVFDKQDGDLKIEIEDKGVTFSTDEFTMSCRFINGRYPNYNSVIPENNDYSVVVDRQSLLSAARRVSVFCGAGGLLQLSLKANQIEIAAQDIDLLKSSDERVPCDYNGPEMIISFNNENVIEVLNNIDSESITLEITDSSRPGLFVPTEQKPNEEMIVLLVPMMAGV